MASALEFESACALGFPSVSGSVFVLGSELEFELVCALGFQLEFASASALEFGSVCGLVSESEFESGFELAFVLAWTCRAIGWRWRCGVGLRSNG